MAGNKIKTMDSVISSVKEKGIGQGTFKNEMPLDRIPEYRQISLAIGRPSGELDVSILVHQ